MTGGEMPKISARAIQRASLRPAILSPEIYSFVRQERTVTLRLLPQCTAAQLTSWSRTALHLVATPIIKQMRDAGSRQAEARRQVARIMAIIAEMMDSAKTQTTYTIAQGLEALYLYLPIVLLRVSLCPKEVTTSVGIPDHALRSLLVTIVVGIKLAETRAHCIVAKIRSLPVQNIAQMDATPLHLGKMIIAINALIDINDSLYSV